MKISLASTIVMLILFVSITRIKSEADSSFDGYCSLFESCETCLKQPNCVWCHKQKTTVLLLGGCTSRTDAEENCLGNFVDDGKIKVKTWETADLTKDSLTQLSLQKIDISNARVGQVQNVSFTYTPTVDYPVDLYFLLDLSKTMAGYRTTLVSLSSNLTEALHNLTKNFTIGFGTFSDKKIYPFFYESDLTAEPAFAFKNDLPLVDDIAAFKKAMLEISVVSNKDDPESSFDALLQAVVCKNEIKWRRFARKIVVVATDATPHVAGDGKIAGILIPNDGKCHLNESSYYSKEIQHDYPSIGLLSREITANSVNVIFCVDSLKHGLYTTMSSIIRNSRVGELKTDSSNMVELIQEEYKAITSSVRLEHQSSDYLKIRYFTSCLETNQIQTERRECSGITSGKAINFTISIEIQNCPPDGKTQTVTLGPSDTSEKLEISVDIICNCPCEKAGSESCPTKCPEFEYCVKCNEEANFAKTHNCLNCTDIRIIREQGKSIKVSTPSERFCPEPIVDSVTGCQTDVIYGYDAYGREQVRYLPKQRCPPPFPWAITMFSIMGAIIAIGMALLFAWRLVLFFYDRAEYSQFIKESENAQWNTERNPLYVQASTTVYNPAFQA